MKAPARFKPLVQKTWIYINYELSINTFCHPENQF